MQKADLSIRLAGALEQLDVSRDAIVVVGVSGGADSVALLHLLASLNSAGWALRLHVAHLNHRIRGAEADADADFVAQLARALRVPASIESLDVPARARAMGVSLEQAGREARFEFFERVCLQTGAERVALAHHADDQAETVLHRVIRGTGVRGLVGIRPSRPIRPESAIRIIRPLLTIRRAEIEQYLRDHNISFRVDASNQTASFTRNTIRNEVIPLLRDRFNPQVVEALLRLGEQASDLEEYLDEVADRSLPTLIIESSAGQLTLDCDALERRPRVIRSHMLRQAIRRLGVPEGDLSYDHLMRILTLAGDRSGSKTLHLPGGLRVTRAYGRLKIHRATPSGGRLTAAMSGAATAAGADVAAMNGDEEHVAIDGTTLLPRKRLEIVTELIAANGGALPPTEPGSAGQGGATATPLAFAQRRDSAPGIYEEWIDADRIQPPLVARTRREGDRFQPLGMQDSKKVSEFMIDQKVAADQREQTVLLCDQAGPIWVVPLRIDDRVRLRPETSRVLRVTVRPLQSDETW